MKRFEEPEINVVRFATPDILTLSSDGYEGPNYTEGHFSYNNVSGLDDGDIPL